MNVEISNAKLESVLPTEYSLSQNQPNPFNPSTDISFSLPKSGQVKLTVYNILGAEVATLVDEIRSAGVHRITWDGTDKSGNPVASGVYLYRLTAGDFAETKKWFSEIVLLIASCDSINPKALESNLKGFCFLAGCECLSCDDSG